LKDHTGCDDLLTLRITYAESGEAFQEGDLKKVKYFMPKYDATALGHLILEACGEGGKIWVAPPSMN
jgi:hypothetical protein